MNQEPKWVEKFREHFVREDGLLEIGKYDEEMILSYIDAHFIPKEEVEKQLWERPCSGCEHHDTFWKTVVQSPQWKEWYEHASKNTLYDVDESQELGIISAKHFQDFMHFNLNKE